MTSSDRRLTQTATLGVAAAFAISLAACGGGGGGNSSSSSGGGGPPQAPVRSSHSVAATASPVAGSVTQSSDVSHGVTANSVTASVSLDSRGLLTADVRGSGWRFNNQTGEQAQAGAWRTVSFVQGLNDGSGRAVTVATDRERPPEKVVASGDVWVSSVRYPSSSDGDDFVAALYAGAAGTLNGVEGTLICPGYDCFEGGSGGPAVGPAPAVPGAPVTPQPEPAMPGSGDPYTFDDTSRSGLRFIRKADAQNPPADADHLILGYWDRTPKEWLSTDGLLARDLFWGDDGFSARFFKEIEYGFFVNGSDPFEQTDIASLTGVARYDGNAFAIYVDTNIDPATNVGKESFLEADATLTANFGDGSENGTVSGTLRNFQLMDPENAGGIGELMTYPTALTLKSARIGDSHSGFFTGDTAMTFDGSSFAGKWGGQFYGNGEVDGKPGSTAGTFGAATTDGSKAILGAFGAYKQ